MKKEKIITIVGARPQFIKAAAISRAIKNSFRDKLQEVIVHTGQHYDDNMSKVFFEEMGIPLPDHFLEVGSGSHGYQTGEMMKKIETVLIEEKPRLVIVYGDTNTTLAGALAASKLHVPVAHIEAGLRSFNKTMPEEINRVTCDHTSTLLFTPTMEGFNNLLREGFKPGAEPPYSIDNPALFRCGDVMYDNALHYLSLAENSSEILKDLDLKEGQFALCTIHRENNTDDPERLRQILTALDSVSRNHKIGIVLPLHPRTAKAIRGLSISDSLNANEYLRLIGPVSYFDMLVLEKSCRLILTDSGGVQKESFFFKKPCLVLRPESEWKELVDIGHAILVDADPGKISGGFNTFLENPPQNYPPLYGDGKASEFILHEIVNFLGIVL